VTPGPIDLKIVSNRLDLADRYLTTLRTIPSESIEQFLADDRNPAAAESLLRRAIESLLDTARHLLAKGFGLGALQYREAARLSSEKGLVQNKDLADKFQQIAGFRIRLTHHYEEVASEELFRILSEHLQDLEDLREELRQAASRLAENQ
jgi:uncharacterized protein YutE (UPF0331/DUF86 family)